MKPHAPARPAWLLMFLVPCFASAEPGDVCEGGKLVRGPCIELTGELQIWNGWPPWLRIEADHRLYGVGPIEHEIFPKNLASALPALARATARVEGAFRVCPLGEQARVPYLDDPIPLYCIERVSLPASGAIEDPAE